MNLSFSTLACPDWSWVDILTNGSAYGYQGVEVRLLERETDLLSVPEFQSTQRAARRRELNDAGFRISGLASSVRFDHLEKSKRAAEVDTGRAYLELAVELGAGFVRVFGDVLADGVPRVAALDRIADGLQQLGEFAETVNLEVVMETHGDFSDSHLVVEVMQRVESPAVGILWDTHHPWRFCNEPIAETFERLRPWIRQTHWKDSVAEPNTSTNHDETKRAAEAAHALMSGHKHADYVFFGDGEFPIAGCDQLLREAGFTGSYCFEWEKAWHPELAAPEEALPGFVRWFSRDGGGVSLHSEGSTD